jgi:hypothetical protein
MELMSRAVRTLLLTILTLALVSSSVALAHLEESVSTQFPQGNFGQGPDFPKLPPSYDVHISATDAKFTDTASSAGPEFWRKHGFTLRSVIAEVYAVEPTHIDLPSSVDGSKRYDFDLVLPQAEAEETIHRLVRRGIEKQFQVRMAVESRDLDVFVLTAPKGAGAYELPFQLGGGMSTSSATFFIASNADFGNLTPEAMAEMAEESQRRTEDAHFQALASGASSASFQAATEISSDGSINEFCNVLQRSLNRLLIDETGLTGRYAFKIRSDARNRNLDFREALASQLGFVLTAERRPVQILAVRAVDASSTEPLTDIGPLGLVPAPPPAVSVSPPLLQTARPQAEVHTIGLDAYGVKLISPSNPDFDSRAAVAAPGWSAFLNDVKPYVALVANESGRKIVAFAVSWTLVAGSGLSEKRGSLTRDPDGIVADFDVPASHYSILPGRQKVVGFDFEISEYKPEYEDSLRSYLREALEYKNIKTVEIALDAVIFDDGLLIGPDNCSLSSSLTSHLKAKQDLYRAIAGRMEEGSSVQEAFRLETEGIFRRPPSFDDLYRRLAADEANRLREKYGDAKMREILAQVILKEPFVIRR